MFSHKNSQVVYYVAIPALTLGLCFVSYRVGFEKGFRARNHIQLAEEQLITEYKTPKTDFQFLKDLKSSSDYSIDIEKESKKLRESPQRPPRQTEETNKQSPQFAKKTGTEPAEAPTKVPEDMPITTEPDGQKTSDAQSAEATESLSHLVIQLSAFKDVGKAHEFVDILRNKGFRGFVISSKEGDESWHRVFVGPFVARDLAEKTQDRLELENFGRGFIAEKFNK